MTDEEIKSRYVLVDTEKGKAWFLPGAIVNQRMSPMDTTKLVELHIILGQPVQRKKGQRKKEKDAAMVQAIGDKVKNGKPGPKKKEKNPPPATNPFASDDRGHKPAYQLAERLVKYGKCSFTKALTYYKNYKIKWANGEEMSKMLNKAGMNTTFSKGFIRLSS